MPVRTTDEGDVADVGGEAGENRETAAREAAGPGEDGNKRASVRYSGREEQVLLGQLERRSQHERVAGLLPQGV